MKNVLLTALALTLALACVTAMAYEPKVWDDFSWWGKSGATPAPVKDAVRSGYWWWPKEPTSNANDSELWGNRGVVYHLYEEAKAPEKPEAPKAPEQPQAPKAVREIPVFNHVLFDFDKSVLKPEGQAEANKVVSWMQQYPKDTLLIEGHTDSIGSDAYNMALGQRRADAVKNYLVNSGVDTNRVTTKSFGESQPVAPNDTPANRALNRRGVFKISVVD